MQAFALTLSPGCFPCKHWTLNAGSVSLWVWRQLEGCAHHTITPPRPGRDQEATACATVQTGEMKGLVLISILLSGIFAAPFMKEEEAKKFIRLKRQTGHWDPNNSQNMWGYTLQEQANEYWTALRTDAQYYMDLGALMFDRNTAVENNRLYMEMLRDARAHLDRQTGQQ
ncbi:hypothetical protein GN956_G4851 [Arapaima gigas]